MTPQRSWIPQMTIVRNEARLVLAVKWRGVAWHLEPWDGRRTEHRESKAAQQQIDNSRLVKWKQTMHRAHNVCWVTARKRIGARKWIEGSCLGVRLCGRVKPLRVRTERRVHGKKQNGNIFNGTTAIFLCPYTVLQISDILGQWIRLNLARIFSFTRTIARLDRSVWQPLVK